MGLITPELLCGVMFLVICVMLMFGYPVAFTLAGTSLLFAFLANFLGLFDLSLLSAFPQRIFAVMRNEVLIAVFSSPGMGRDGSRGLNCLSPFVL